MNTKKIPAVISLLAGLVSLIVTYVSKAELVEVLTTLFIVLLSFYILGCLVRAVFDKFVVEEEVSEEDETPLENIETEDSVEEIESEKAE